MRVLTFIAILFCFGCSTTGNPQIMKSDSLTPLQIGVTTRDEVRTLLGEPQETMMPQLEPNGQITMEAWRYTGTEQNVNLACFIPIVDVVAGKQTAAVRTVDLYFTKKGVLNYIKDNYQTTERAMPIATLSVGLASAGIIGAAASNPCGYGYGYQPPGKAVVSSSPQPGGGNITTIKWYR